MFIPTKLLTQNIVRLTALYILEDDNVSMVKSVVRKVTNIIQKDIGRLESGIKSIERSDNVKTGLKRLCCRIVKYFIQNIPKEATKFVRYAIIG